MEIRNMRSSTKGIHIDLTSLSIIYDNDQTKDNLQGKIITWDKNNITNDINDSSIPNKYAHQNTSTKVSTSLVSQSMEESLQMKWKSIIHPNVNNNVSIFNEFHCYYWKLEFILDCMNMNKILFLGKTPKRKYQLDKQSNFSLWEPSTIFDINIPGSSFLQHNPDQLDFTNISLLRFSLILSIECDEMTNDKENENCKDTDDVIIGHFDTVVKLTESANSLIRTIYSPFH